MKIRIPNGSGVPWSATPGFRAGNTFIRAMQPGSRVITMTDRSRRTYEENEGAG